MNELNILAAAPTLNVPSDLNITNVAGSGGAFENTGTPGDVLNFLTHSLLFMGFSLAGLIVTILLLKAGWIYMTSGGEVEPKEKSIDSIKKAVLGLIVIGLAYVVTSFVLSNLGLTDSIAGFSLFDFNSLFNNINK